MTVLVCHDSEHGSTRSIAERIAARLRQGGTPVDVTDAAAVTSTAGYEAAVAGSAIHNGQWLPDAAQLLRREEAHLATRPVWLFSVGMVGDRASAFGPRLTRFLRRRQPIPDAVSALALAGGTRVRHHRFTGVFLQGHTSRLGRVMFRAMGGRFGDHRDWADVDAWADAIAAELSAAAGDSASMRRD